MLKNSYLLLLALVAFYTPLQAQVLSPIEWSFKSQKQGVNFTIELIATPQAGWHIYSQFTDNNGPIPTKISLEKSPLLKSVEQVKEEGDLKSVFDKNFRVRVRYFSGAVKFIIKGKLKANISGMLHLNAEYMTCNDEKCLPPTKKAFEINLK